MRSIKLHFSGKKTVLWRLGLGANRRRIWMPPAETHTSSPVQLRRRRSAAQASKQGLLVFEQTGEAGWPRWLVVGASNAHGFISLEEGTIFAYKVTAPYAKECDGGIRFDDPTLDIPWPTHDQLIVSEKDRLLPTLSEYLEQPAFRYREC